MRSTLLYLAVAGGALVAVVGGLLVLVSAFVLIAIALGLPPWAAATVVALLMIGAGAVPVHHKAAAGRIRFATYAPQREGDSGMAEGASDELKTGPPSQPRASVEAVEADIVDTRERLSMTLAGLNAEVRALLDPGTPVTLASGGTRDVADKIVVGLRTTGQIRALARLRRFGPLGVVTGLGVFLFRSGMARRLRNRKGR